MGSHGKDKGNQIDAVAPISIDSKNLGAINQKVVSGAFLIEQASNAGGRLSQQSQHQAKESENSPINNSNHRDSRKQQILKVQQKQGGAAEEVSNAINGHPHVIQDSRPYHAADILKQKQDKILAGSRAHQNGIEKLKVENMKIKNDVSGFEKMADQQKHKQHMSSGAQAKPTIELKSKDFVSAASVGPATVQQMFQVSKMSNPTNRMSQIHENIQ